MASGDAHATIQHDTYRKRLQKKGQWGVVGTGVQVGTRGEGVCGERGLWKGCVRSGAVVVCVLCVLGVHACVYVCLCMFVPLQP